MSIKRTHFLLALAVLAFVVRFAAVLALRDIHAGPTRSLGADGIEYDHLATQLSIGHGYVWSPGHPTSFRAPGFPIMLAGVFALSGHSYPVVYLVFCLIGAAGCVMAYLVTRELADEKTARLAGLLAVVYIPHIYFSVGFDTENLFALCLALSVWLLLRFLKSGSMGLVLLSGLALGWASLTRPFALLLIPMFLAVLGWHLLGSGRIRALLPTAAFFLAACVAVVAPWTVRNHRVHHQFVAVATNGGSTFYGGNNDRVLHERKHLGGWLSTGELPHRDWVDAAPNEVAHDRVEWNLGKQWVRTHLASMPLLEVYKFVRLWLPEVDSLNRKYVALQLVGYTPYLALYLVALAGVLGRREYRTTGWLLMHTAILGTILTALIFWGSPRFRDANAVLLMAYAAVGLRQLAAWYGRRQMPAAVSAEAPTLAAAN